MTSSIYECFAELAAAQPSADALIDGVSGVRISRKTLQESSQTVAERLREAGVQAGQVVALQLPNSAEFVATILALLEIQAIALPVDRDSRRSELEKILGHFGVSYVVSRPAHAIVIEPVRIARETPAGLPHGTALLKLTSGSTGMPKAVMTSQQSLVADCRNICSSMRIKAEDLNLGAIPFSHSYGFSNLVTPLLVQGTAVVFSNDYLPVSLLDLANRFACSVLPGIPMMFDLLSQTLRSDGQFRTVRTFISAGAPLSPAVSKRFTERFGSQIQTFYGCSECGGITYDRIGGAVERGEVGSALDGVVLSIDDNSARMTVRGDAVASGYLGASEDDGTRFSSSSFVTDDLARLTAEGAVQLIGRIGDVINTAGKKVNPREVESILLQLDGVNEARVYGEPAGSRGEVVAAVVVAEPGISRDQIRAHCRQHLSSHKVPRIVKLIDTIPVDDRGKINKAALSLLSSDR